MYFARYLGLPLLALSFAACGAASTEALRLHQVVLYRNGVGYFEHRGAVDNGSVSIRLGAHEIDDFLSTVTVVDSGTDAQAPSAVVPRRIEEEGTRRISLAIAPGRRDVLLAYVTPTSVWRPSYRLILDEAPGRSLLQAWAIVDNTTAEDWNGVELALATHAPFSFAVDLRTPRTVDRPDVTGYLAPQMTFGPVGSTSGREIHNGDSDHDSIVDVDDRCPDDPETWNGLEEDDGCPDRAALLVEDRSMVIIERVLFAANSFVVGTESRALVDAIAQTLASHPEIRTVEVEGHASSREHDPWRLSADRAAAVRHALTELGVSSDRLVVQAYAATRPLAREPDERNQRVEFRVVEQGGTEPERGSARFRIDADAVARTARSVPSSESSTGGTRYPIARRVSIPANGSAMVSILNTRLDAGEVLFFQPDERVPGSDSHPFRAARMTNTSGVDLVPGPVALFSRGEFVGEGLFDAVTPGETAFIPFSLDTSSRVSREEVSRSDPGRIVSLARGQLTIERVGIYQTTYVLEPGAHLPARWFVRHVVADGYEPRLSEGMFRLGAAVIAPGTIAEGRRTSIVIEERRTDRDTVDLFQALGFDLRPFLAESSLDASVTAQLTRLQEDRDRLLELSARASELHTRLGESSQRSNELRVSLSGLDGRNPEVVRVRRELATRLAQAIRESEASSADLATVRASEAEARARLRSDYRDFVIAEP